MKEEGTLLNESRLSEENITDNIIFFNSNINFVGGEIYFSLDGEEFCKLEKKEYVSFQIPKGDYQLTVYHWDFFKFQDNYSITIDHETRYIGVFAGIGSTHYSYYDDLPEVDFEFKESECMKNDSPNKQLQPTAGSGG